MMCKKDKRAFTLIEILVVVIILATLASAVMISMHGKTDEAKVAVAKSDVSNMNLRSRFFGSIWDAIPPRMKV